MKAEHQWIRMRTGEFEIGGQSTQERFWVQGAKTSAVVEGKVGLR